MTFAQFVIAWCAFVVGWGLRAVLEASNQRRRRGGYVRRVPMASVHPREPKP
jgi:hypothetical protein